MGLMIALYKSSLFSIVSLDPFRCCTIYIYIYIYSTNIGTEYFKHAAHSPFFSSKCRLFHDAIFFGYCIIHILHTGCAKI